MREFRFQPPRQSSALADHTIFGDGDDENERNASRDAGGCDGGDAGRCSIHTATLALMCGCGS